MDYSKRTVDLGKTSAFARTQINFQYFLNGNAALGLQGDLNEEQINERDNYKKVVDDLITDLSLIKEILA